MCIFCAIVNGDSPGYHVYENDKVIAFLDIHPVVAGHTVVIPKTHVERLDGLRDEATANALMQALIDVPNRLMEVGLCTDFTILSDNGSRADQDIPHVHFHVIPRHVKEEFLIKSPTNEQAAKEKELKRVWTKIHKHLA